MGREAKFGTWTNDPQGNGLVVTGPPLEVHIVYTRGQAEEILKANPGGYAQEMLSQAHHLPDTSAHAAIRISGSAGLMLAKILTARGIDEDTSFVTISPRQILFFPSMPEEDLTGEAPNLLMIEIDESRNFHCYVLFSRVDGREHMRNRTWIRPERAETCLELLERSLLPETAETPKIHITGHAAYEIFSAGAEQVHAEPNIY